MQLHNFVENVPAQTNVQLPNKYASSVVTPEEFPIAYLDVRLMKKSLGSSQYDIIIVGAGPAGAAAAYTLGRAGQRVLVLEKETLPRYKPCGGGLSAALLAQFPFSFEPVIESQVTAISYAFGKREITISLPPDQMRMVMRDAFDHYILQRAQAEVRQNAAVRHVAEEADRVVVELRNGHLIEGRYLIAADGAASRVAREVGLRRKKHLAAAIEAEVLVPDAVMRRFAGRPLFIFGEVRRGYLWVFPKAEHLSVGIGAFKPGRGELQRTLQRVMTRYDIMLDGARLYGHPLPIYTGRQPIATRRVLLVGDAAGLVDPLTGEGIRFAVESGRLAAAAIVAGQPERYQQMVRQEIGRSHTYGLALAWLFYHFPRACYELGVRNPLATMAFVDLLSGRTTYPRLIARLFGTLPLFFATEALAALSGLLGSRERRRQVRRLIYGDWSAHYR